jgi:hypothetical protein
MMFFWQSSQNDNLKSIKIITQAKIKSNKNLQTFTHKSLVTWQNVGIMRNI